MKKIRGGFLKMKTRVLFRGLINIDDDGDSELVLELTHNDVVKPMSNKMWNWIISLLKKYALPECRVDKKIVYEKMRMIEEALKENQ